MAGQAGRQAARGVARFVQGAALGWIGFDRWRGCGGRRHRRR